MNLKVLGVCVRSKSVYSLRSSAKSCVLTSSEKLSEISLIYILKRIGPKTLPWGIPLMTGRFEDVRSDTDTLVAISKEGFDPKKEIVRDPVTSKFLNRFGV